MASPSIQSQCLADGTGTTSPGFSGNTTAGNSILVGVWDLGGPTTSVTDGPTLGSTKNTYTKILQYIDVGTGARVLSIWRADNTVQLVAGTDVITATSSVTNFCHVTISEYAPLGATRVSNSATGAGTVSVSLASTVAGDVCFMQDDAQGGGFAQSAGSLGTGVDYALLNVFGDLQVFDGVSSGGTVSMTSTGGSPPVWNAIAAAFAVIVPAPIPLRPISATTAPQFSLPPSPIRAAGIVPAPGVAARLSPNVVRGPQEPRGPQSVNGGPANPPAPAWCVVTAARDAAPALLPPVPASVMGFGLYPAIPQIFASVAQDPVKSPTPAAFIGFGNFPSLARILASIAQDPVKSVTPTRVAGFGSYPAVPAIRASLAQDVVKAPTPSRFSGFGLPATAALAYITAVTVPPPQFFLPSVFPGSTNDPSTITVGGVNGTFLPDEAQSPVGPARFVGATPIGVSPQSMILTPPASAPPVVAPSPALRVGFGQAAQRPVVLMDPQFATATFDPIPFSGPLFFGGVAPSVAATIAQVFSSVPPAYQAPTMPFAFVGFGQAAQVANVIAAAHARAPVVAPLPVAYVGFGLPAQIAAVLVASVAPAAVPVPTPAVYAGFGQAAQAPITLGSPIAPFLGLPPTATMLAGFGQAAQIGAVALAASAPAPVPSTTPAWFSGFGQAAQAPVVLSAMVLPQLAPPPPAPSARPGFGAAAQPPVVFWELVAPSTDLPPTARVVPGVVPAATTSGVVFKSSTIGPQELPPRGSIAAGFGQAAQVAQVVTAPYSAPSVGLFVTGRLVAGFGQAVPLPPPFIGNTPRSAPAFEFPPQPARFVGFGLPAQIGTVTVVPFAPPTFGPLVSPTAMSGIAPAAQPPVAFVASASNVSQAILPPRSAVFSGFGQAAQAPAIYSAFGVAPSASLPSVAQPLPGVAQPLVVQASVYGSQPPPLAILAPAPALLVGFGKPAQTPMVTAAAQHAPRTDLPPTGALFVGILIQPAAYVYRSPTVHEARLPPTNLVARGFGLPAQTAIVITIPFGTADRAVLPPTPGTFLGFGSFPPSFFVAPFSRWSPIVDATGAGRVSPIVDATGTGRIAPITKAS